MKLSRLALLSALFLSAPAFAQDAYDPVADAASIVEAHKVSTKVGCSIPVPALWDAPPWEQQAAQRRREAFNDCLAGAMEREQNRLDGLTRQVDQIRAQYPDSDWSGVDVALNQKWNELETLESKLNKRDMWANTAVSILDTFTGPGAPFSSTGVQTYSPYGQPYMTPSPYGGYYRRDTSVSAPGIK
jgi:hypothetical protein